MVSHRSERDRLEANGLSKRLRRRNVVDQVSFHVESGEIVGLLGPNGAGKTTTFYLAVGLIPADGGRLSLNGRDLSRLPIHARARAGLGYLPQEPSVFRKLTVAENIIAILDYRPALRRPARLERLEELMEALQIEHLRHTRGYALSGGERRRVEIARALASNPRFLLLDEPFAGVDPIAVGDIQVIVEQLAEQGIGILITDHNVRETLRLCGRSYVLSEGRVIAEGSANEIVGDAQVRKRYLGEGFTL